MVAVNSGNRNEFFDSITIQILDVRMWLYLYMFFNTYQTYAEEPHIGISDYETIK